MIDLLAKGGVHGYVYPVGRLDYDSEGLLLLTSDGELAARLTHPRHGVAREYEVRVRGVPDRHALDRLARGVTIDGRRTATAEVRLGRVYEAESGPQGILSLVIHEGRNRQVRNMSMPSVIRSCSSGASASARSPTTGSSWDSSAP